MAFATHVFFGFQSQAVCGIDDCNFWHSMRRMNVHSSSVGHVFVESVRDLHGTNFDAGFASNAFFQINECGLLQDRDVIIANEAFNTGHFGIRHEYDVFVFCHVNHLGRENASAAIKGWKGLIQLAHSPANACSFFDYVDFESRIGKVERSLYSSYAAADDEDAFFHSHFLFLQRFEKSRSSHAHSYQRLGLFSCFFGFMHVCPRNVLSKIDYFC